MHSNQAMTVCSPETGIDPESNLGGAVYDREILKALAALGVRVVIPLPRGERCDEVANWEIIETPRHRWKYYEYNLIFRREVLRLIAEGRAFQVLRAHAVASTGPGMLSVARKHSIPCHLHYHHWERHPIRNLIERWTLGRYDLITTDSDYSRRDLIERYGLRNRVAVAYPGVPVRFSPGQPDRNLRARFGRKRVLLFVGALVARKNLSFLLRVFGRLRRENPEDVSLVLAGTGPLDKTLRQEAERMGLGGAVFFTGRIGEREKVDYYRLCDIFVFPSLVEGFGMAPAEAMAFGKPVVAANTTSLPEVIADNKTGFLVDPHDEEAFAAKIALLLDSPPLATDMGRAGQKRVAEQFDFTRTARYLLDLYERLLPQATDGKNG